MTMTKVTASYATTIST